MGAGIRTQDPTLALQELYQLLHLVSPSARRVSSHRTTSVSSGCGLSTSQCRAEPKVRELRNSRHERVRRSHRVPKTPGATFQVATVLMASIRGCYGACCAPTVCEASALLLSLVTSVSSSVGENNNCLPLLLGRWEDQMSRCLHGNPIIQQAGAQKSARPRLKPGLSAPP